MAWHPKLTMAAFAFMAASLLTGSAFAACQQYNGAPVTLSGTLWSRSGEAVPDVRSSRLGTVTVWDVDRTPPVFLTLDHPICMAAGQDGFNEKARSGIRTVQVIFAHRVTHRGQDYTISLRFDQHWIGRHVSVKAMLFPGYYDGTLHYRTPVVIVPAATRVL